jgi:hypothetical protein
MHLNYLYVFVCSMARWMLSQKAEQVSNNKAGNTQRTDWGSVVSLCCHSGCQPMVLIQVFTSHNAGFCQHAERTDTVVWVRGTVEAELPTQTDFMLKKEILRSYEILKYTKTIRCTVQSPKPTILRLGVFIHRLCQLHCFSSRNHVL